MLQEYQVFFSYSSKRQDVLYEHVKAKVPRNSFTRWNYKVRIVSMIVNHFEGLKSCLEQLRKVKNEETQLKAQGLLHFLNGANCYFWLKLFKNILQHTQKLLECMQSKKITACSIQNALDRYKNTIQEIRESDLTVHHSQKVQADSKEICDFFISGLRNRFRDTDYLLIANLLRKDCYTTSSESDLDSVFSLIPRCYPDISVEKLKNELSDYYSKHEYHEDLTKLLKYLINGKLTKTFGEMKKLVEILLTVPMTTAEAERKFSTLKRVKTPGRSTMNNERLVSLVILSTSKKLFKDPELNLKGRVKSHFINHKERRMDFVYQGAE